MNRSNAEVSKIFESVGALILGGHFVYTSGKHGSAYVNKDALYPHTALVSFLCKLLAEEFLSSGVEVVAAPVVGAVILSQWVARHVSELCAREVLAVYAEKTEFGGFSFKRGYDQVVSGRKVLVVEDVLNTGGSAKKVVGAVRGAGGSVVGLAALCNRGGVKASDIPQSPRFVSLLTVPLEVWEVTDCPLCHEGVPINSSIGKGSQFLSRAQH